MRVLLDECIPRKLKYGLPDHECRTVPEAGLAGKKNGSLLDLAESAGCEIFVTMDKGLEYEQNLAGRNRVMCEIAPAGYAVVVQARKWFTSRRNSARSGKPDAALKKSFRPTDDCP
jgi:hypothetical protein